MRFLLLFWRSLLGFTQLRLTDSWFPNRLKIRSPHESGIRSLEQVGSGQLSSQPAKPINVDAYDVDGFDTSGRTVGRLHRSGSKAICYVNVGAWENWRPDKNKFPKSVLGKNYAGWAGEKWLDIRRIDKLAPIMRNRLDVCKQKGFDAVEPDNMDNYTNKTGFPIRAKHQLRYNKWLAREAHKRGLAIALKNDLDQARQLQPDFDFAITEDCFDQGWCGKMTPFIRSGKSCSRGGVHRYRDKAASVLPEGKAGEVRRYLQKAQPRRLASRLLI